MSALNSNSSNNNTNNNNIIKQRPITFFVLGDNNTVRFLFISREKRHAWLASPGVQYTLRK